MQETTHVFSADDYRQQNQQTVPCRTALGHLSINRSTTNNDRGQKKMTVSKSTRDYIKNWGRTAAREHKEKTFQIHNGGLNIGQVKVQWCEPENDFIWVAVLYSLTQKEIYMSEADATAAVHKMYHDMMSTLTFGAWIRVMCRWNHMTIAGLAERLGVTRQTVHNWVKGTRQCGDLYIYNQIAALFADLEQMSHKDMLGHMSLLFKRDK